MKNLIIILSIIFASLFANETSAQKTELYINFQELIEPGKVYTVYFSASLYEMSIFYKYKIKNENEINGVISMDKWERFPFQNFYSNKLKIFYTIEDEHNCVEGEINKKIKIGEKNFFKFKKGIFGLKIKKCENFECE